MNRRSLLLLVPLAGCASLLGRDPLKVSLAGIEPLQGQGLELRLAVKLRVQNPNDTPVDYDGLALDVAVGGTDIASGVSDARGSVPRFGETVLTIPVTLSLTGMVRQAISLANGNRGKLAYEVRGKLSGGPFGSTRFETRGEFDAPALRNTP